ncbi:MAG TPA: RagB/SusD family nutrient uptake outer membrane protein [Cyclobacteriaceae bacterium]|nr:RagB/SusD family nutrient uptake outer membrane protein [Cyclobacteriaceae bacterium]
MIKYINNKIKHTLYILTFLAGIFSCQTELLDPTPQIRFSDVVVFDTPSRIAQQVNGLYSGVKSGQFLGGRFFVYGDIRAENFLNETSNGVTGLETWRHNIVASTNEVNNLWASIYSAINRCNMFLEGIDANTSKYVSPTFPSDFVSVTVPQYKAEARFLRALSYLALIQMYGRPYADGNGSRPGVPLRLQAQTSSDNNDLARSSVAEVYAQILSDLNFAEQNLPLNYSGGSADYLRVTRAHRNSAIALKTRVYLNMGQYDNVITEANKIVSVTSPFVASSGVQHTLQDNINNVFSSPYTTLESIFSMPFTPNNLPGVQNGLGSYYNPGPLGIGDYTLNPDGILGDLAAWPATDARRNMTSVGSNGKTYLRKFPTGPQHTDYAPVIRYAEVLLNLAEAIARTTSGVDARALDLVNAVRQRADASVTLTPASNAELIEAIMTERNIELLGEGFRANDFIRLLQEIPGKAGVTELSPNAESYVWPIPVSELNANKLI